MKKFEKTEKFALILCVACLLGMFLCAMFLINCNKTTQQDLPQNTIQYQNVSPKDGVIIEVYSVNCNQSTCRLGIKVSNLTNDNIDLNVKCVYEDNILFNERRIVIKKSSEKTFLMLGLSRPFKTKIECAAE
jgi:hypothetical protein